MLICSLPSAFGGRGRSTQFSACQVLTGFFGAAIAGLTATATVYPGIVQCPRLQNPVRLSVRAADESDRGYYFAAIAPATFNSIFGECSSVLCTRQCSTASSTPLRCATLSSTGASTSITKFVMRASGSFTFSQVTRTASPRSPAYSCADTAPHNIPRQN